MLISTFKDEWLPQLSNDSGIEPDDNLANIEIQHDFPSIQSNSSSGVEPVRYDE